VAQLGCLSRISIARIVRQPAFNTDAQLVDHRWVVGKSWFNYVERVVRQRTAFGREYGKLRPGMARLKDGLQRVAHMSIIELFTDEVERRIRLSNDQRRRADAAQHCKTGRARQHQAEPVS